MKSDFAILDVNCGDGTYGSRSKIGAYKMQIGSIVLWRDARFGVNRAWTIEAVLLGGEGQESLVRLRSMFMRPGVDEDGKTHDTVVVPEVLIRNLEIFEPRQVAAA